MIHAEASQPEGPFESASELREAHARLLEALDRQLEQDASPAAEAGALGRLEPEIRRFLERGAATGVYLEEIRERTACQALLDYWLASLGQAGIQVAGLRLARFDAERLPDLKDVPCPYVGLEAFRDQTFFFGRESDTRELLTRVLGSPLVVVLGASGSGKSSLVMGGVLPALAADGSLRVVPPFVPRNAVLEPLAEAEAPPALITIDQFEEVFTLSSPEEREALVASLAQLLEAGHHVILTVREEFRSRMVELRGLSPYLDKAWYSMRPMDYDELRAAVEKPAALANLQFQAGIVDDLVKKVLGQPAALPLLQFTLRLLWEKRDRNRITWEVYGRTGDPLNALKASADQFYDDLLPETQIEVKRVLLELVRVDDLLEAYRQPVPMSRLLQAGKANTGEVIKLLAENDYVRVTPGATASDVVVEVKHESLVRNWPRFVVWIDNKRIERRQRLSLSQAAQRWAESGKPAEGLLTGWQLEEAKGHPDLSVLEKEFVEASARAVERAQQEREDAVRREEKQKLEQQAALEQQRRNRRNAALVLAGALVVIVLAALAGWSMWKAAKLLHEAESTRLMANADRLQDANYDLSLLVNLEAVRVAPTLDASAGLLRRFVSHPHLSTFLPGHKDTVFSVAFSPDGKRLASASQDNTVILWNIDSRKPLATLEGHKNAVNDVAFSPDGRRLASASEDNTVILWDVDSHKLLATLEGHKNAVNDVAFSPNGRRLASASWDEVILWNVDSRKPLATLEGHMDGGYSVAFSPDGKRLAVAGGWGPVTLWDVDSRKRLPTMNDRHFGVLSVAFSPDGKRLALASRDNTVILWDVDSPMPLPALKGHKGMILSVAFSPDGKRLASASQDNTLILWDVDSQKPLATLRGHKNEVNDVAFSLDGKLLASVSQDNTVILWDVDSLHGQDSLQGHKGVVFGVAFSPDGKRLASASWDETMILWDVASRMPLATLKGHKGMVFSIAISPDGKRLASASEDNTVILWDVASRKPLATLEGHKDQVIGVAFSPNGKQLASASYDSTVILWDVDSRKLPARLEGHKSFVVSVAFSPDGKRLASASFDKFVILWDVDSRKALARLEGHKGVVVSVAFSPDAKQLVSASWDGTMILWDLKSGKPLVTLEGHKGRVNGVAISPDGKRLASASLDQTVILWDLDSRKPLATLEGHEDVVWGVAFSPDGKQLASASKDKTVILWDVGLDLGILSAEACRTANRNLTCEEWRNYLGADKPYRKTCEGLPGPEKCD